MLNIYHNPRCSKSRQTLQIIEDKGLEVKIIEYLKTPPTKKELAEIIEKLGISPRQLLRKGEEAYKTYALDNAKLSDSKIISCMIDEPKLMERPIVVNGNKAVLGRPPENVLGII